MYVFSPIIYFGFFRDSALFGMQKYYFTSESRCGVVGVVFGPWFIRYE